MVFDILTVVFIESVVFATQTIAVSIQFKVNKTYRGLGFWLIATALQAVGCLLMLALYFKSVWLLSVFANPLVCLGLVFLYFGIMRFIEKKPNMPAPIASFTAFLLVYYYFVFFRNSISGRALAVAIMSAVMALVIGISLIRGRGRHFSYSAGFTAVVFLAYGCFQSLMAASILAQPPVLSYDEVAVDFFKMLAFIVPIFASMLWTFGFIIMVNQRLNSENVEEKEKLQRSERAIRELLAEKDLLLKEIHHRVKNNMATIQSLLSLQAENSGDPSIVDALEDAENRVRSMMMLYDKIYKTSNYSEQSVSGYLPGLVDEIVANFPNAPSVLVEKDIEDFPLDVGVLQPLGIIVGELLTNVMKYAFTGRADGVIVVSASCSGGLVSITIADNGNGVPDSVDFVNSTGFGLVLVHALTQQLRGTIRMERGNGTRMTLEFRT